MDVYTIGMFSRHTAVHASLPIHNVNQRFRLSARYVTTSNATKPIPPPFHLAVSWRVSDPVGSTRSRIVLVGSQPARTRWFIPRRDETYKSAESPLSTTEQAELSLFRKNRAASPSYVTDNHRGDAICRSKSQPGAAKSPNRSADSTSSRRRMKPPSEIVHDLRPKAPAFIRRVLFLHSALLMGWHARRAWRPQVAQARGAHLRACLLSGPSAA